MCSIYYKRNTYRNDCSGSRLGIGTAFCIVPVEIKHCYKPYNLKLNFDNKHKKYHDKPVEVFQNRRRSLKGLEKTTIITTGGEMRNRNKPFAEYSAS